MTGKDGDIDGKKPGRRLCQGNDIDKVFVFEPLSFHQFAFDGGYHRNASTNGEGSDFGKDPKYIPQTDHIHNLS